MTAEVEAEVEATIDRLGMRAMFEDADKKKHWFFFGYQSLWFSPGQLRAQFAEGKMRWGAINWQVVDPSVRLRQLRGAEAAARTEREMFEKTLAEISR